jgi:hypothetical protein
LAQTCGRSAKQGCTITNAQTRQMMLNVAKTYDRLTEEADLEKAAR